MKFGILWGMDRREHGITPPPEITEKESQAGPTETSLQPGVREKTYNFLIAAKEIGAFENLDPRRRNLISIYFGTEARLSDLRATTGIRSISSVSRLLHSGMEQLWQNLPSQLQEEYPSEEVIKLKKPLYRTKTPRETRKALRDEYRPERELWEYAMNNDLLSDIVATGMVNKEEMAALRGFFKGKGARKPSEGLLNRFSIALVRVDRLVSS